MSRMRFTRAESAIIADELARLQSENVQLREALELARKRIEYFGSIADEKHQEANRIYFLPPIDDALSLPRPQYSTPEK